VVSGFLKAETLRGQAAAQPNQKAGLDLWLSPGRFAIFLGLLVFAAFPEILLGTQTFVFRDFGIFGYPLAHHLRESFWRGEVPLLNPYNDFGIPFLAQWNTMVLYPGSLFYVLLPLSWSLGLFCVLHLYLGGLGMYHLGWRWTESRLGATVAGVAFAFNGLTLHSLMWPNNIACLALLPWVILCVERAWREGGTRVITGALVAAAQVLAGAPEILAQTWFLIGGFFLLDCLKAPVEKKRMLGRAALLVLLVTFLTAVQMLPFFQLLYHSHRDASFGNDFWAMPGTGWANLFVPLFYAFGWKSGVYYQYEQQWTSSYYTGVGILALAVFAVWQVRDRRVWLLGGFVLLSLIISLGDHSFLYPLLRKWIPVLGFVRYTVKFVVLAIITIPLLAAFGIKSIQSSVGADLSSGLRRLLFVFTAIAFLIGGAIWFAGRYPEFQLTSEEWSKVWQNGLVRLLFLGGILGLLLLYKWLCKAEPNPANPKQPGWIVDPGSLEILWAFGLLLTLWGDVMTHAPRQNPTVKRWAYEEQVVEMNPRPVVGQSRALVSRFASEKMHSTFLADQYEDYTFHRAGLVADCNLLESIPKVDGFYSLYLREERPVRFLLYTTNYSKPLADFSGVAQENAPGKVMEWQPRLGSMPFATAGQKPVFMDAASSLGALTNAAWNPRETVFLSLAAKGQIQATNNSDARILSSTYTSHRQEYTVTASEPSLVVVAQANYVPWKAFVNGKPTPIWQANHAFQAIEIPAGTSLVKLVYEDRLFQVGAALSVSTLILCGCMALFLRFRPRGFRPAGLSEV
jgi:hypothetical protein